MVYLLVNEDKIVEQDSAGVAASGLFPFEVGGAVDVFFWNVEKVGAAFRFLERVQNLGVTNEDVKSGNKVFMEVGFHSLPSFFEISSKGTRL